MIGSRWVPGGSVVNWPWHRRLLSRGGNLYTRALLGIPVRDATAGFRLFRRDAPWSRSTWSACSPWATSSRSSWSSARCSAGLRVVEVPIEFVEREHGDSKMTPEVARESLRRITRWGLSQRLRRADRG